MPAGGADASPDGLFKNGNWLCNCLPRLPAIRLQVRKETANKGRWFWACQQDRTTDRNCGFYLWAEDADARMKSAVLSNSRTEPAAAATAAAPRTPGGNSSKKKYKQTTLHGSIGPRAEGRRETTTAVLGPAELDRALAAGTMGEATTPVAATAIGAAAADSSPSSSANISPSQPQRAQPVSYDRDFSSGDEDELARIVDASASSVRMTSTTTTPAAANGNNNNNKGSKRKRSQDDEGDEYGGFSSGEEAQLATIVDSSSKSRDRHGMLDSAMPTPLTEKPVRRVLFATDAETSGSHPAKHQRLDEVGMMSPAAGMASSVPSSPSSSMTLTPSASQEKSGSGSGTGTPGYDAGGFTREVLALLRSQRVEAGALADVAARCDLLVARYKGLEKGREAARQAIRKAEARAAELQDRVADLENARRLDAEARRKMREELIKVCGDN